MAEEESSPSRQRKNRGKTVRLMEEEIERRLHSAVDAFAGISFHESYEERICALFIPGTIPSPASGATQPMASPTPQISQEVSL